MALYGEKLFLKEKIPFLRIGEWVWEAMEKIPLGDNAVTLQAILEADREARAFVRSRI